MEKRYGFQQTNPKQTKYIHDASHMIVESLSQNLKHIDDDHKFDLMINVICGCMVRMIFSVETKRRLELIEAINESLKQNVRNMDKSPSDDEIA